jgi:hypothetical protein
MTCRRIARETGGKWCADCPALVNGVRSPVNLGALGDVADGPRTAQTWKQVATEPVADELRAARAVELTALLLRRGASPDFTVAELRRWNHTTVRPPLSEAEVARVVSTVAETKEARS